MPEIKLQHIVGRNSFHDATLNSNIQDCRVIEVNAQKNLVVEKTDIYNIIATAFVASSIYGLRVNPSISQDGLSGTLTIKDVNIYNIENLNNQVTSGSSIGIEYSKPLNTAVLNISSCKI